MSRVFLRGLVSRLFHVRLPSFNWVRDGCIAAKVLVGLYDRADDTAYATKYEELLWDMATLTLEIQNHVHQSPCQCLGGPNLKWCAAVMSATY
jgi:hypothetical protein